MIYSCNLLNVAYGDGTVVEMVTLTRVGVLVVVAMGVVMEDVKFCNEVVPSSTSQTKSDYIYI